MSAVRTTPNPKTRKPEEMESLRLFVLKCATPNPCSMEPFGLRQAARPLRVDPHSIEDGLPIGIVSSLTLLKRRAN